MRLSPNQALALAVGDAIQSLESEKHAVEFEEELLGVELALAEEAETQQRLDVADIGADTSSVQTERTDSQSDSDTVSVSVRSTTDLDRQTPPLHDASSSDLDDEGKLPMKLSKTGMFATTPAQDGVVDSSNAQTCHL